LRATFEFAARSGRKVAGLLITSPDNPTGRTLSLAEQAGLARYALQMGAAYVLIDWIYHYVTDEGPTDLNKFLRQFEPAERQRLIFLDGLTKSLRIEHPQRPPGSQRRRDQVQRLARPHGVILLYYVRSIAAYEMGYAGACRTIIEPTNASRQVLKSTLDRHGFTYILGKGYYAFIQVAQWLRARGWADSEPLGQFLAEEHGLAVVPGVYFSPYGSDWIRFSYATPPERTRGAADRLLEALSSLES
jgi:aspartate/methionine/tyrosine aminotransferase